MRQLARKPMLFGLLLSLLLWPFLGNIVVALAAGLLLAFLLSMIDSLLVLSQSKTKQNQEENRHDCSGKNR